MLFTNAKHLSIILYNYESDPKARKGENGMNDPKTVCCFTGHRNIPTEQMDRLYALLDETILALREKGVRTFRAGGAMGFDTVAALRVLYLKSIGHDLELALVLPCRDQSSRWSKNAVLDYNFILSRADSIVYLYDTYNRFCMLERDRALVDGSGYCVSYLTQNRGGTAYTVSYALKKHLELINLGEHFPK